MTNNSKKINSNDLGTSNVSEFQFKNAYRGKTVLVTGHTGFKGTWLSIWLEALGANVIGYSLEPATEPSIFKETALKNKITHLIGDIRDEESIHQVIQTEKPEFIFHLAAQSLVRLSYRDPKMTFETNIIGLLNLFEAVRSSDSVQAFINVTSDKCYQNREWVWGYRENDPLGGDDPYSSSKACSELITKAYRRSFFNINKGKNDNVALASTRAGNVIGGGDWAQDRIIPDCIRSLVGNNSIIIRNPNSIRPWQHVIEVISGYLWLGVVLQKLRSEYTSAWNFGPKGTQTVTVKELVEEIIKIWGKGSWKLQEDHPLEPHEANYLKLDCSKTHHRLRWFTLYNVTEAIYNTINWYKSYYNRNKKAYNLCLKQIKDYISLAKKKELIWSSVLDI